MIDKRAVAGGLQITIGNIGAIIGTQIYRSETAPRYVTGHSIALAYAFANIVVTSTIWFVLTSLNRRRTAAEARREVGDEGDWKGDADPRWFFSI